VPDLDPFEFYRTLLFVFLGIYFVVTTAYSVVRIVDLVRGDHPSKRLLRTYLGYQIVSIRLRPLAGELVQIAALVGLLALIAWAHRALAGT